MPTEPRFEPATCEATALPTAPQRSPPHIYFEKDSSGSLSLIMSETQSTSAQTEVPESPEVECPVCYQEYDQHSKLPRMLECLHVFCTECLRKIQLTPLHPPDPDSAPSISCPLCRHSTPLQGGDAHSLPCNSRILAQLPPVAFRLPASVSARLATVTQRLVLSLGERDTRFIILPTVSLRVEQMGDATERANPPRVMHREMEVLRGHKKTLMCVQVLAVIFWVMFVLTCVVGVVFGPSLFHN
ncbi:RING finger domain-containing protein isoform X1 [Danio rerio]|uniref:RING finger domain-containing protein isoform X1 n=2 Tax=Danio rerio TaxID=7955 RepID=A0AB32TZ07_DANRE